MRWKWSLAIAALAVVLPMSSERADSSCLPLDVQGPLPGGYPLHELSPLQSLRTHDAVFLAEVLVPTRPCSLGFCAGLKTLSRVKGKVDKTILVSVRADKSGRCAPPHFAERGSRWVVFANTGMTRRGTSYLEVDSSGPTFKSRVAPDFRKLEQSYLTYKAQLDRAIEARLGPRIGLR